MTSADRQIVAAYESGMQPNQIAETLSYELEAIKLSLQQHSKDYQIANNLSPALPTDDKDTPLFSKSDLDIAKETIKSCMFSEVDAVRLKAAVFTVNEAKGRNDLNNIKNVKLDITIINERIANVKAAKARALNLPIINIEPQLA